MGTYLYGIMAGEHRLDFGRIGLPDGWAPVATLPVIGLTAVVSEYPGPAFRDLAKADLLRCLAIHQRVVERAMAEHTVLPARFGTVLTSRDEARAALGRFERRLAGAFGQLGDSVEIEVAATWDLKRTFAEIGHEPAIVALAASTAGSSAQESLAARVQVGKLVKEALDRRRAEFGQPIVRELAPIARDAQPNPLTNDELVLNVAFLVDRVRLDEFSARVHRLDDAFENRLNFRLIGPLPPYSFATVELTRLRSDEIDAARRLLELGDRVSVAEVHAGYRRLAARCHPDLHPEDPTAPQRFAALAAAHNRLLAYLRGQGTGEGEEADASQYDLSLASGDAGLLLAIQRSVTEPLQSGVPSHVRDTVVV